MKKKFFILALIGLLAAAAALPAAEARLLLKNAHVLPIAGENFDGDILIIGTKIAKLGKDLPAEAGTEVIDLKGRWIMPGIIDSHSHIAIEGGVNETGDLITAEVDIRDVLNPEDLNIFYALTGGVTSIHTTHGSANPIGGRGVCLKLRWGADAEGLLFKGAPLTSKWALGENPKQTNFSGAGKPRYPRSRMGVEESIRLEFDQARAYMKTWETYEKKIKETRGRKGAAVPLPPRKDYRLEAVADILRGKLWVRCHAYQGPEMASIIRLCREYGVKLAAFEHGLEGYRITNELVENNVAVSTFADFWAYKWEAFNTMPHSAALMAKRGVLVALNSDDAERMRHLFLDAAKTLRFGGLSELEALKTITLNPAIIMGVDKLTGTLEAGKDADIAVFNRHPLDPYTVCQMTIVDGKVYFDRAKYLDDRRKAEEAKKAAAEAPKEKSPEETTMKKIFLLVVFVITALAVLVFSGPAGAEDGRTILIKNATLVPVTGAPIAAGQLLIRDGKIAALGTSVDAPAEALVIDAAGQFVYPGFIDAYTHFGLVEISAVSGTVDVREMGKENPEVLAARAINPASIHFGTSRINGTTAALVAPAGGTFPGQSSLVRMDGWTVAEMALKETATSLVNFPMSPGRPGARGGGTAQESKVDVTSKLVEKISEYLKEARRYLDLKKAAAADSRLEAPALNRKFEALAPVLDGTLPVILSVEKEKDIELALKFIKEEKLKAVFRGCSQGFKVASKIKEAGIPVIIDSLYVGPVEPEDGYDAPFRNVIELVKAGVPICFSSGDDPAAGKDLPYHAARAVAYGLDHEEAIKALTINPARIFGVEDRLGSLETGKDADLFITTGDPLDTRSEVRHLFIGGRHIDMKNYWDGLYEKYQMRPIK